MVDRVADVVFFAVAFGATVTVSPTPGWVRWVGVVGAILTVVAVAAIALVSLYLWRFAGERRPDGALRRHLMTLAEGLRCVRTPGIFWWLFALTAAAWGVWMLGAWLVGESLGITLSLPELLFTTSLLGLSGWPCLRHPVSSGRTIGSPRPPLASSGWAHRTPSRSPSCSTPSGSCRPHSSVAF